jgi:hypothetical protein
MEGIPAGAGGFEKRKEVRAGWRVTDLKHFGFGIADFCRPFRAWFFYLIFLCPGLISSRPWGRCLKPELPEADLFPPRWGESLSSDLRPESLKQRLTFRTEG